MTILCIETSTSVCSAAICVDGKPTDVRIAFEGGNHACLLPTFIDELLSIHRQQIDAVAVSDGPGSYTGLRIGASMAKGICYGLHVSLIPVPTLQILCVAAMESMEKPLPAPSVLCPMIDARRMEVYTALYNTGFQPLTEVQAVVVEGDQSMPVIASPAQYYYFGDGAAKCQSVLNPSSWHFLPDVVPQARYMGVLAEHLQPVDVAYYEPFYLKDFIAAPSHIKGL